MSDFKKPVLVTGAAGYLASWVVSQLLATGCAVRATVRSLADSAKVKHLHDLAARHPGLLTLFEADLLKEGSFDEAAQGCGVVFHVASPYFLEAPRDFERELLEPARRGTLNVIGAINRSASVHRLVLTASVVSLYNDAAELAARPGQLVTDTDYNRSQDPRHNPYAYSKTVAEQAAREAQRTQSTWDLVTIHPGAIFGPSLSKRGDATSVKMLRQFLDGSFRSGVPKLRLGVVDVRDAAEIHVRAALKAKPDDRFIAVGETLTLLDMAKAVRPADYGLPDKLPRRELPTWLIWLVAPFIGMTREYVKKNVGHAIDFDNRRSQVALAMQYRSPTQTFGDHLIQLVNDDLLKA